MLLRLSIPTLLRLSLSEEADPLVKHRLKRIAPDFLPLMMENLSPLHIVCQTVLILTKESNLMAEKVYPEKHVRYLSMEN